MSDIVPIEGVKPYTAKPDLPSAEKKLLKIFDNINEINSGTSTWQEYFQSLKENGDDYLINLIKNTSDLSKLTGEDLVNAYERAQAAAIKQNQELRNQSTFVQASNLALRGLALAGDMLIPILASKVFELAYQAWDRYAHSVENARAALQASTSQFNSLSSEISGMESQLENIRTKITDINSLGGLRTVDSGNLELLQAEEAQLERELFLLKEKQALNAQDTAQKAETSYNTMVTSRYRYTERTEKAEDGSPIVIRDYEKALPAEELELAAKKLQELETEYAKNHSDSVLRQMRDTRQHALEMAELVNNVITANEALLSAGYSTSNTYQEALRVFKKSQSILSGNESSAEAATFHIAVKSTSERIDKLQHSISSLSTALSTLRKNGSLTANELIDLQQEFPSLATESNHLEASLERLIDNALDDAVAYLQNAGAPSGLIDSFKAMAEEAKHTAADTWESLSSIDLGKDLQDSFHVFQQIREELSSTRQISIDSLNAVSQQFPELADATAEFSQGLLSTNDLLLLLEQAYNVDAIAYKTAMLAKLSGNDTFFGNIREHNSDLFTALAEAYGDDVQNWRNLAEAKAMIEQALISQLADKWGTYYGSFDENVVKGPDGQYSLVSDDPTAIYESGYQEIEAEIAKHNKIIRALNEAASIEITIPDFNGLTPSAGNPSAVNSPQAPDPTNWLDRSIELTKQKGQKLEQAISDAYTSYIGLNHAEAQRAKELLNASLSPESAEVDELIALAQKAGLSIGELQEKIQNGYELESRQSLLAQLVEEDRLLLEKQKASAQNALQDYENAISKIPEYRGKIEGDGTDTELLPDNIRSQVEAAVKLYDNWQTAEASAAEQTKKLQEDTEDYLSNHILLLDKRNASLERSNSLMEEQIALIEASGGIVSGALYEQQIANLEQTARNYTEQIEDAESNLSSLDPLQDSDKYHELMEQVDSYKSARLKALEEIARKEFELAKLPVDNLQTVIDMYQDVTKAIQNWGAEAEASGKKLDAGYYQALIVNSSAVFRQYREQADLIQEIMGRYDAGSKNWNELYSQLQSVNSEMSSLVKNMHEYNQALLQLPLTSINEHISSLQQVKDALEQVQSDYDTVISAVTEAVDAQKEALHEANVTENEAYQSKIGQLQERLDLLNRQNEQLQLQTRYEQALYALESANQQKTERVIRDGQIVYETNKDNLAAAREEVQNALADLDSHRIQTEIDSLNEALDSINVQYEKQVEALEEIAERWSRIKTDAEAAANAELAARYLGADYKDKVLTGNDGELYNAFQAGYTTNTSMIHAYEQQLTSTQSISALLEDYIEAYKAGTMSYETAMSGIRDILSQMNQAMSAGKQLQNVLDYQSLIQDTEAAADAVLTGLQAALTQSSNDMLESMKQYNDNLALISDCMTSWEQLVNNTDKMVQLLEEVRDNLADALDGLEADDDEKESSSGGTIHSSSGGPPNGLTGDAGNGPAFHHRGVYTGYVGGSSDEERLKMLTYLSTKKLETDDIPIIAQKGELVLTEPQQKDLIENFARLDNAPFDLEKFQYGMQNFVHPAMPSSYPATMKTPLSIPVTDSRKQFGDVHVSTGDIHLPNVRNTADFAREMGGMFESLMRQKFSKMQF